MEVRMLLRAVPLLACFGLLVSCEQTVKRTLPPGVRTIHIEVFSNLTGQAILSAQLHEEIRRAFRLDGRMKVVDEAGLADAILAGEITEYSRRPARFDPNNVVQEYRLRMVADLSLTDFKNRQVLWTEKGPRSTAARGASIRKLERFINYVVVPAEGLPVETEIDAQRRMVREFSQDVVLKVIEGW